MSARFVVDGATYTAADMLKANESDEALCAWVASAKPGDRFPDGIGCDCIGAVEPNIIERATKLGARFEQRDGQWIASWFKRARDPLPMAQFMDAAQEGAAELFVGYFRKGQA